MLAGMRVLAFLAASTVYAAGQYCFGFLNAHPERTEIPNEQAQEIQKQHMAHLGKMAAEGHLVTAGPLATPGGARGLLVYRCASAEQAAAFASADPAVTAKRLSVEMYAFSSAGEWGQPLTRKLKADPQYKYEMVQLPFAIFLRTGTAPNPDATESHRAYLEFLRREGKARGHGLFAGSGDKLGVAVYAAMPIEEARKLAEEDPLVKGGFATAVMHVWYVADEAVPK
jgi:uncharacterized protein YciI